MGMASIFMPTVFGIIADRWANTERLYGVLHIFYAMGLVCLAQVTDPDMFFWVMLFSMGCYMPTLALSNALAYSALSRENYDIIKIFPQIRVWGTVGFIAAMWVTNLTGSKATVWQFYIAACGSILLAFHALLFLPKCPPENAKAEAPKWKKVFGVEAFCLFANYKMALFFLFSMFLGAALQLANAYGDVFVSEFAYYPKYVESWAVKYSTVIISVSQISEMLFILAIPFVLQRFGIRRVMIFAMLAWVLRFGLFAYGNPSDGLWMIILSCIVYGLAFDFFNISGSLFVESSTSSRTRSSAQGIFMMMTNGIGAVLGAQISGFAIDKYFTVGYSSMLELAGRLETTVDNNVLLHFVRSRGIEVYEGMLSRPVLLRDWHGIWLVFAVYMLIVTIAFVLLFKDADERDVVS
jgi:NHS family xanthosine MFS transporter